jgi:hypothetical protein
MERLARQIEYHRLVLEQLEDCRAELARAMAH